MPATHSAVRPPGILPLTRLLVCSAYQGCCYGCGAKLQVEVPLGPGFVKPDKYETKKKHRQLDKVSQGNRGQTGNKTLAVYEMDLTEHGEFG